ncbi:MAG: SIR2 family protein [Caldilineaceae bacterium SB0666_bin_21]|nr:SIR2 family protein [Caldilineaceae bacterium SB0666_bin_21]
MTNSTLSSLPPDLRLSLDEIAQQLYTDRATLMVGSGFSRNATTASPNCEFPDWTQLGDTFYEFLYNARPSEGTRYLSVPELAHEVEAATTRSRLEEVLRNSIPDLQHEPSNLHIDLLSMPWKDIFTTNYDTLLERASTAVTSRRYDTVTKQADLVFAVRPRIIKLHGTLPTNGPFVITDDDYRRYPKQSAPLLNTVRQSLLENTMCLLGFSGTDPNFLHWIGWIHDNLGRSTSPRMFLIGSHELTRSQAQLLEKRNIVAVNMSALDEVEIGDHYRALECFIYYLKAKQTDLINLLWPHELFYSQAEVEGGTLDSILHLTNRWRNQRKDHPGWVILPEERRQPLLWDTEKAIGKWFIDFPEAINSLNSFVDIEFAFEILWRAEICLLPIFDQQIHFFETVVERYWSYAKPQKPFRLTSIQTTAGRVLTRNQIRTKYYHILLGLARYYRENGDIEKWESNYIRLVRCLPTASGEYRARYYYERTLAAMYELDYQKLQQRVAEWQTDDALPFWTALKAAIMVEIGQVSDAATALIQALELIRKRSNLNPIKQNYSLVSQEAVVMLLLQKLPYVYFQDSDQGTSAAPSPSDLDARLRKLYQDDSRLRTLNQYKSDPRADLRHLELILSRPPTRRSRVTEAPGFDIGSIVRTTHVFHRNTEMTAAYGFLRYYEDTGLLLALSSDSVVSVLSRIVPDSYHWALVTLARAGHGDAKMVDQVFGRQTLSKMPTEAVDRMTELCLNALNAVVDGISIPHQHWTFSLPFKVASVVPEVLSRLCSKCSTDLKLEIVKLLRTAYESDAKTHFSGVVNLMRRLLNSLPLQQRVDAIPSLLEFPILSDLNLKEAFEFRNPFIFLNIAKISDLINPSLSPSTIVQLIQHVSSTDADAREWASLTLARLHEWSFLTCEQEAQFGEALWSQVDDAGWPDSTLFQKWQFLSLPCPDDIDSRALFGMHLEQASFPGDTDPGTSKLGDQAESLFVDIQHASSLIAWTDDEVRFILEQSIRWWDDNQIKSDRLNEGDPLGFGANDFKVAVVDLINALTCVFQYQLRQERYVNSEASLEPLIESLVNLGLPALPLRVACLDLFSDSREHILKSIKTGLASTDMSCLRDALDAVSVLVERAESSNKDDKRADALSLFCVVGEILYWRRNPGLPDAISTIARVISLYSWVLSPKLEHLVLGGLQYLIDESCLSSNSNFTTAESNLAISLDVRCRCARLAYAMFTNYLNDNVPVPPVIVSWRSICQSETEFIEVRNEWPV